MSDTKLLKHCMCGCMYLEAKCPNCNKVTDADRIEQLVATNEALIKERDEAWKRAAHAEKMWGEAEVKLAIYKKYRDAYAELDRIGTKAVCDLEVKLETAVEALDMLVRDCEADYPPSHVAIKYFAIGVLAEISSEAALNKGESHD